MGRCGRQLRAGGGRGWRDSREEPSWLVLRGKRKKARHRCQCRDSGTRDLMCFARAKDVSAQTTGRVAREGCLEDNNTRKRS
jgi:hypothetical protein